MSNRSQLAGFSKRDDVKYFLKTICNADYRHEPLLAPTQEILDAYKKSKGAWEDYERQFLSLMSARQIESKIQRGLFKKRTVLLCNEETAKHCHRRLVLEYLDTKWGNIEARHL